MGKQFDSNWLQNHEAKLRGKKHKPTLTKQRSELEVAFIQLWKLLKYPDLVEEHRFCPDRKWRFDFAHLKAKVAIEVEGGHWSGGRHTRGKGFENDCIKYNRAQALGWVVFRLTRPMININELLEISFVISDRLDYARQGGVK